MNTKMKGKSKRGKAIIGIAMAAIMVASVMVAMMPMGMSRPTATQVVSGDTIYIDEQGLTFDLTDAAGTGAPDGTYGDIRTLEAVDEDIADTLSLSATYTVPSVDEGKYYYDVDSSGTFNTGDTYIFVKEAKITGDILLNNDAQDSIVGKSVPTSADIVFKAELNFGGGKIPLAQFKIELTDPDGVVIETIDGQALTNLDAALGTTIYVGDKTVGGTITAPEYVAGAMSLVDIDTGTYKVKIKTDKTDCNMLDISSPEYTFTIRSEEVAIEAIKDTVGVGEDMQVKVNGNPKDWYYLIVTGIKRVGTAPSVAPEIKDTADVKARDTAGAAYPVAAQAIVETNLAAWIQTGSDGVADVKIATTGADDRTYTIKVYEVPDNVGGVPGATGAPGFVAPNPPAVLVTAATFVPDEVTGANNDVSDVATDDDEVKIKVEEAKVTFDIPASVMIGEEIDIKGSITAGDRIDLIIKDHEIVPGGNDEPVDENNEFEVKWDTSGYTTGSYTIEGYIDETTAGALADYDDIDDDGKTTIRLVEPGLTAKQLRDVVAEDDDYAFEGTATGVDDVDCILIGPKGWKSGTGASLVNGLLVSSTSVSDDEFSEEETMTEDLETGAWIALILAPGRDGVYETGDEAGGLAIGSFAGIGAGKNQAQILAIIRDQTVDEAGSDDLLVELRFKVESPYVRLDPIASVAKGEPLNVSGVTNREPETTITISTFAGPLDLPIALAEVEWPTPDEGVFSGSIDTSDAVLGTYTIEADDGDGNTDTKDVEIVTAVPTVAPTAPEPTVEPTEAPTAVPTAPEPTVEPTAEPTPEPPGFEAIFAIAGLLAIAYLVLRRRK